MTKETEELLFDTIESAINFGVDSSGGEFDFTELYKLIDKFEKSYKEQKNKTKPKK